MLVGQSLLNNGGLRVPTIYAPEYADQRFQLLGVENPPGTILELRNMTFVLPDGVFDAVGPNGSVQALHSSGMMDYFELGKAARVCIINR